MRSTNARSGVETGRVPLVEVVVSREMTAAGLARLLDEALLVSPEQILVDLAGWAYLGAEAIGMLLDAHRRAVHGGVCLALREPPARVRRNLRLAGAEQVLTVSTRNQ